MKLEIICAICLVTTPKRAKTQHQIRWKYWQN